jgi:imidazolonepropionase-like amidohydrolase
MRRIALIVAALAGTVLVGSTRAQEAPRAETALVLKAAHLFDGVDGRLQSPGVLVIEGERITGVGPGATIPANARVLDLGDATLLPGIIDAHVHLTYDHDEDWSQGFYDNMLRFPVEQSFHAARNARVTLQAGVTSARNVGATDYIDVGLRNAIDAGLVEGPRLKVAGYAIGSTGGHCDESPFPPERIAEPGPRQGVCNGADSCRQAVREQMKFGADVIKICASGGVLSEADPVDVPQLTPAELAAIVGEAHAWGRKVAAHAHGDLAARLAVEAGVDSIEHGSFLTEPTLRLMKQKGTWLVPTRTTVVFIQDKADRYPPKIAAKARAAAASHGNAMRMAIRLGVPIAFGTDATVYPHGLNAREFGDYVDLGMAPAQALLTSSQGAARLLGIDGDTGTLVVGKAADVVAVRGDVLANVRTTEAPLLVVARGRIALEKH